MNKQMTEGQRVHREWYSKKVNPYVKNRVLNNFGLMLLLKWYPLEFPENSDLIPLSEWDKLAFQGKTPCESVCINKEAARQVCEEHLAKEIK